MTKNILTLDKWIEFKSSAIDDPTLHPLFKSMFAEMQNSPYLIENFLQLDSDTQTRVQDSIYGGIDTRIIGGVLELRDKMIATGKDIREQLDDPSERVIQLHLSLFEVQIRRENLIASSAKIKMNEYLSFVEFIASAFSIIYNETELEKIVMNWIDDENATDLADFVAIALRWDELQDYPLGWSSQMVR